jgi:putative aldouronate transport system substrate-binding protein
MFYFFVEELMKKFMAFLLVLGLAASAFAGGGQSNASTAGGGGTLSLFVGHGYGAVNTSYTYEDNTFTRKISDETGVRLIVDSSSTSDMSMRVSTMLNTGDYPEAFYGYGFSKNDLDFYARQGIFIPLDSYDLSKYPTIKRLLDLYPVVTQSTTGADGKMYALPAYNDCLNCDYDYGTLNYYMPWMRDNGIKKPTNYDELISFLRYVKANDVNGNGNKNDEIPMLIQPGTLSNAIAFWARNYMNYITGGMAVINGKVTEQYKLNEFRSTLWLMNTLYKEGIFNEDMFTITGDDRLSLVNAQVPVVGAQIGRNAGVNRNTMAGTLRWIEYNVLPPLVGQTGQSYTANAINYGFTGMVITDKCKDPERAIAVYDHMLSYENQLTIYAGTKGEGWFDPDPGTQSYLGGTPLFKSRSDNVWGLNTSWQGTVEGWTKELRYGEQAEDIATVRKWLETGDPSLRDRVAANPNYYAEFYYIFFAPQVAIATPASMFIPPLAMSDVDNNRLSDINATFGTYYDTAVMEFITGVKDINRDADWNTYLTQLDQLGAAERAAIYQKYLK